MNWYILSIIALISMTILSLCSRWAANLGVSARKYNLYIYAGILIGFIVLNLQSFDHIFAPNNFWLLALWGLLAGGFSIVGSLFEFNAIKYAPNAAYAVAVRNSNMIPILFLSALIFGSAMSTLGIVGILFIGSGLFILGKGEKNPTNQNTQASWFWLALGSMAAFTAMVLAVKQLANLGFSSGEINLSIFFFATIGFMIMNLRTNQEEKEKPLTFKRIFWPVFLAILVAVIGNYTQFWSIKISPNPGYSQAIMNADTLTLMIAAYLIFGHRKGGDFNAIKWLGAVAVVAGVILLAF